MSLPIKEIPAKLKTLLSFYKMHFTRPQYKNFRDFVAGLIVSDNKTVQEIADCFGRVDQSSLNRFLTASDWNEKKINDARIRQIKSKYKLKKGILICDPTMLQKYGKFMEKANYHYNGITKDEEWGYMLVSSIFNDGNIEFPVCADFYLRKDDADEQHPFRTVREICIEQIDYALKKLSVWLFMSDAGLYADFLIQHLRSNGLKYVIGTRVTNKISIKRNKRISIQEYLNTLTEDDFQHFFINGEAYFLHSIEIIERGAGKEKLLISYKSGDEKNIKCYVTNLLIQKTKH